MRDEDLVEHLRSDFENDRAALAQDVFSVGVVKGIVHRRRRKNIILGAVGTAGSAIAGAQLTSLVGGIAAAPGMEQLGAFAQPEVIATSMLAGVVAFVAWTIPNRV